MEIALGMFAYRANFRCFLADNDMSAVGAFPYHILITRENYPIFYILEKLSVTLLVNFLDGTYFLEQESDISKAFLLGCLGETGIHVGPLVVLTGCSICSISHGVRNFPAMKEFEPYLRMFLLVLCCVFEESSNLYEAILDSLGSIILILCVCL